MADYETIMKALRNAHAAGDTAAAQRLAQMAKQARSQTPQAVPQAQAAPAQERGFWQRVGDNVIGFDDGVTSPGEKLGTWLGRAGESATLGVVGDEASAAAYGALPGRSYDGELQRLRQNEEDLGTAGRLSADLAGALVPGAGAAGLIGRAGSWGGRALAGAAAGGASGFTYGLMEGEGGLDKRFDHAKSQGVLGLILGGAIPAIGAGVRATARGVAKSKAADLVKKTTESHDGLLARAVGMYDDARRFGAVAQKGHTAQIADDANRLLSREGLITPKGSVAEAPKVRHAYQMLQDFAGEEMNPEQMQTVRKAIQAAARSTDEAEARIGTMMLRQFDDAIEPLAPQFKEANALYRRAMKSEKIQEVIDLAGNKAGQFSGSGYENALRTEFRALNRRIIKGQEKGWTADEKAMIARIANGGTVENIARDIGKAAPRGIVSTAGAGGVPFAVGTAIGGPVVGGALGAGALAIGEAGRRIATRMQTKNAGLLEALARSETGMLPQIANSGAAYEWLTNSGLLAALAAGQRQ